MYLMKRKIGVCIIFQEKWTGKYFCVSMNVKVLCLISSERITIWNTKKVTKNMSVLWRLWFRTECLQKEIPKLFLCNAGELSHSPLG